MLGLCLEDGVNEGNLLKVQFCFVALGPALASILLQVRQHQLPRAAKVLWSNVFMNHSMMELNLYLEETEKRLEI